MPYRILCNGVQRDGAKPSLHLASGLFCCVPLHKIRYGIHKERCQEIVKQRNREEPILPPIILGSMTVERPHELFAPPTDAGSHQGNQDNPLIPFAALQEQAQPEIIELVSILYDTYTLRNQLQAAATETIAQQGRSISPSQAVERYGTVLHIEPSFSERCRRAGIFVEAAMHIMRGSFTAYPEDPAYLRAVIDAAYSPYGFQVADGKGEYTAEASEYHASIERQLEHYGDSRKEVRLPYKTLHWQIDDDYSWEPVGLWDEEPMVLSFTEQLNQVRKVELALRDLKRNSWFREFRSEEKAEHVFRIASVLSRTV